MTARIVDAEAMLAARDRVVSRGQGIRGGLTADTLQSRVRGDRWQRLYRGVYASFSGDPDRAVLMWGALLRAGPGAVFSHQTAAEIHGLLRLPGPMIHITVPADRHPARRSKIPGVVIHRCASLERTRHPASSVPCTRVEDTVLDLIAASSTFAEKFDWVSRAVGGRLTTADRIAEALGRRGRFPGRAEAMLALGYAREGIMSWLELQWATRVERPHGLPAARRQVRVRQATGNRYLDNLYEPYRVCVELDGRAAHPESEQRRDNARDRWNLAHENIVTMRFDTGSLSGQRGRCEAAAALAKVLRDRDPVGAVSQDRAVADSRPAIGHPCARPLCREAFAGWQEAGDGEAGEEEAGRRRAVGSGCGEFVR